MNTHTHTHALTELKTKVLNFHCYRTDFSCDLWQTGHWSSGHAERRILFLDQVNLDPLLDTHTHTHASTATTDKHVSDTDLQVKCSSSQNSPVFTSTSTNQSALLNFYLYIKYICTFIYIQLNLHYSCVHSVFFSFLFLLLYYLHYVQS